MLLPLYISNKRTRRVATWCITIFATPLIYFALIQLLFFWMDSEPSRDFDQSFWLRDREERYQMADDLIESGILIGKDTNQVRQLLGPPGWSGRAKYGTGITDSWFYNMGIGGGGLGFLFHNLIVKLDKGRVVAVEHGRTRD